MLPQPMTRRRAALTLATAGAVGVLAAPAAFAQDGANANTVKLKKAGATTLTLDKGTANALEKLRITLIPVEPSTANRRTIKVAITGGSLDPRTASPALINHSGGLTLQRDKTKVTLRALRIRVNAVQRSSQMAGANATLSAAVGGARATIATLDARKAEITRPRRGGPAGIGTKVSNVVVKLNKTGAGALNTAFHTSAFKYGMRLGKAVVDARPSQIVIERGSTALTLDPGAVTLLTGAGITLGVIAPAKPNATGALTFPITRSSSPIPTSLTSGTIGHIDGISLTKAPTTLALTQFDIRLGAANTLAASVTGVTGKVEILNLDFSNAQSKDTTETGLMISRVKATLTKAASDALTATFNTPSTENATLGTVVVNAELR